MELGCLQSTDVAGVYDLVGVWEVGEGGGVVVGLAVLCVSRGVRVWGYDLLQSLIVVYEFLDVIRE